MPLTVEFPSARQHCDGLPLAGGLLYEPSTPRVEAPTSVVVLHEWWGMDDFARHVGERLSSRHGFRCLVLDVFRGHRFTEAKLAKDNMMTFDYEQAAHDVRAAAEYLRRVQLATNSCEHQDEKTASKGARSAVGCIGFGFGAQLAILSACPMKEGGESPLQAVAPVCGTAKGDRLEKICKNITCPVQGHYAEFDVVKGVSSPEDYNNQADKLRQADISLDMKIYPAKHAFFNPVYPSFNSRCTEQFFLNVSSFMDRNL